MEQAATQPFGLREHLTTLFRHKGKILAIFIATVLVAGPGSFLLTKVYRAKTRILIRSSRQPTQIGAVLTTPPVTPGYIPKDEVNTEVQVFKSPILAEKLV